MASQKTKMIVGLFVASGLCISVLAFIWLGMSRYLEKGQYYVTYFDESIQGLDADAPVKYRGVPIGRVESISVAPDSRLIQAVLKTEPGKTIDKDIVAQLKTVGITGSMFVELDRKRDGEPDRSPAIGFPSEYPIIASKPSEISKLVRGIDAFLSQMNALDVGDITEKIKLTLDNVDKKVSEANVKGVSDSLEASVKRVDHILEEQRWTNILANIERASRSLDNITANADRSLNRVDKTLKRVDDIVVAEEKNVKVAIEGFRDAATNANTFIGKGSSLVSGTDDSLSQLQNNLSVVTRNLERASENLNRLMEFLADQPSQFMFGEPPAPRPVEFAPRPVESAPREVDRDFIERLEGGFDD